MRVVWLPLSQITGWRSVALLVLTGLSSAPFLLLGRYLFGPMIPHYWSWSTAIWAAVSGVLGGVVAHVFMRIRFDFARPL